MLLFFGALTALFAWPLSVGPSSRALPLSADTRLFLWTLSWDVHALLTSPWDLFDANIFFPERRTLAYSEHLVGSALVGAPFLLASGNPVLAMNAVVLLSCVLSGAGAAYLGRRLGLGWTGALAAGVVFAFAPPRFERLAQVHLATVQWIPFCLGFLHGYLRSGRRRDLLAACGLFTLQSVTSGHGGLFLALAVGALLAWLLALGELRPPRLVARDLGFAGTAILGLSLAFLAPYLVVQREVGLHRTLGAVYDWAPNAASFLAAPTHAQQWLLGLAGLEERVMASARAYLFPGWIPMALAALALARRPKPAADSTTDPVPRPSPWLVTLDVLVVVAALAALAIHVAGGIEWTVAGATLSARTPARAVMLLLALLAVRIAAFRRRSFALAGLLRRLRDLARRQAGATGSAHLFFYMALAVLSVWAALGPGFGLYTVLYRLLPGFDLIRVPSRLTILALLALAVLCGAGLDRLSASLARRSTRVAAGAAVLLLVGAELAAFPIGARDYPLHFPAVDRWLAEQPRPFVAAELPVPDPGDATRSARLHSLYMLHSTLHWQPVVNGYSGLVPPRHERLFRTLTGFPDDTSLRELEALGVDYAVLHRDLYPPEEWRRIGSRATALGARLRLDHEAEDGRVYRITAAAR